MLFRHLEYLIALAREKHFARAAASCGVSQPALSAGIKQLEEDLGLLVVERGQRFQGFTAEGERVLAWSRRIVADCASLAQEAAEMRAGLDGQLRLGVIPVALPIVDRLTTPFLARHPNVRVTITSLSSADIQRGIDDFTLDAGISYLDNEPLVGVRTMPLYRERFFLVVPHTHPLAEHERVGWRDAAGVRLCLFATDMQNRRIIDECFAHAGLAATPAIESNSLVTLCAHVLGGEWCSILPQTVLILLGHAPAVRAIPLIHPDVSHTVGLVFPDREPLTPSGRALAAVAGNLGAMDVSTPP
jgi:DNA-binding transcriptional LysR family regulator